MTPGRRSVLLVAWREITERTRGRALLLSTLAIVAIVLAGVIVPGLQDRTPRVQVGLTGPTPAALTTALRDAARDADARLEIVRYATLAAGERAVRDGRADVLVDSGRSLVWRSAPEPEIEAAVTAAWQRVQLGVELPRPGSRSLEPVDADADSRQAIAFASFIVLLMMIMLYGSAVAEGVAQEKGTRVMELLVCRVRPRDLLAGKVLGIGLVGFAQMLLCLVAAGVAVVAFDTIDVPDAVPVAVAASVLFFALGYTFWSMAFAAAGALVSRAEDLQAAIAPLTWAMLPFALLAPVASEQPEAWYVHAASYFPTSAPFVMPVRIAVGDVAAWEVGLSAAVMIAATYGLVRLGGAVYAGAVLRSGARPGLRDVWSAARRR